MLTPGRILIRSSATSASLSSNTTPSRSPATDLKLLVDRFVDREELQAHLSILVRQLFFPRHEHDSEVSRDGVDQSADIMKGAVLVRRQHHPRYGAARPSSSDAVM